MPGPRHFLTVMLQHLLVPLLLLALPVLIWKDRKHFRPWANTDL